MPTNPLRLKHIRAMPSPRVKPGVPSSCAVPRFERDDYCQHNQPGRVCEGRMTEEKMQNCKKILKNEELRNNKAKLAQIICQKLGNRFKRVPKADIRLLVHKFVSSRNQINASDLSELEEQVREMIRNKKQQKSSLPGVNDKPESDDIKGGVFGQTPSGTNLQPCQCENCLAGRPCLVLPKGHEWEALSMYQAYQAGIKEKNEKAEQKRKQQELKAALDLQVQEMKMRHKSEKNAEKEYMMAIVADLKKFNDEKQAKLEKEISQHERAKAFWEKQIAEDNALHRKEKSRMIKEEQENIRLMKKKEADEQRKISQKKEEEARIHRLILEENARNKVLLQERIQQEKNEDNQIMIEYAKRLDAEEKRRQDAFQKRMDDLERIVKLADDGPVGKGRRDQEKREEELLLKQQLAKEEADARRERNDLHAKMERDRLMAEENKRILEEQDRLKKKALEQDKRYSEKYKRQAEEYKLDVTRQKQVEHDKCERQRRALDEQMQYKRREKEDMNQVERSINHSTIDEIREDLTFQGRLQHRIRMARARSNSRPNTPNSARGPPKTKNAWM